MGHVNLSPNRAADPYAAERRIKLPIDQVSRIARITHHATAALPHLVRARNASPEQLIGILAPLGAPYTV